MGLEILAAARGADGAFDLARAVDVCRGVVNSQAEAMRQATARTRIRLYFDDYRTILEGHVFRLFKEPAVAVDFADFIPLVGGSSFVKRVADELARPLYASDPVRRVAVPGEPAAEPGLGRPPSPAQLAWNGLAAEMDVNAVMDQAARLVALPCDHVYLFPRMLAGADGAPREMTLCLLTPDMVSVVADPRNPARALAIMYAGEVDGQGKPRQWICWDDRRWFSFRSDSAQVALEDHPFGVLPIVDMAKRSRPGQYWHPDAGADAEAAALLSFVFDLILVRKLQTQSHIQLVFAGAADAMPKGQIVDQKSVLTINGEGTLTAINLESDPSTLLASKQAHEALTASNYGISLDRLNQKATTSADDEALKERVDELAQVVVRGERQLFRVVRAVSLQHPLYRLPQDATSAVDLGHVHYRTDRETQLRLRAEEIRQGLRSSVDSVLEDNPEYGGDRAMALEHIRERASEQMVVWSILRAANAQATMDAGDPGQTAQQNGRSGPAVRDGRMTRDEAAAAGEANKVAEAEALANAAAGAGRGQA